MSEHVYPRRLRAILSADAVGYSRLMRDDEQATVRTITGHRAALADLVQQYRGRVVDSPGDNLLAEFGSVVDAVNCAVEMQRELAGRNAALPDHRRMPFRVGINLGDVLEEGERIYGDGVNVAARMEGMAEAGGICLSGTVYDAVESKIGLGYEYLGERKVKNIDKPIRAYRVLAQSQATTHGVVKPHKVIGGIPRAALWGLLAALLVGSAAAVWHWYFRTPPIEPASLQAMAYPLPDKPSIAVLPFVNMSDDPQQEYFSDGISEDIITALSRLPELLAIARNASFSYKGKEVRIKNVAEELGVRYVLQGSVRKSKNKVRVTAQLIDALTGLHLWADRYDRDLKAIFAVQDEITKHILTALQVKLAHNESAGESVRLWSKGTENLEAYLKFWQAMEKFHPQTISGNALARNLLQEAISLDPNFPAAYALLGFTYSNDILYGVSESREKWLAKAMQMAKKALALDDTLPGGHRLLGWLFIMMRKHEQAFAEFERAVALEPNSALASTSMSMALRYMGRHKEALEYAERAVRLNPKPTDFFLRNLGIAYLFNGRYEQAIKSFKTVLDMSPGDISTYVNLAVAYVKAGQLAEARAAVERVIRLNPKISLLAMAKLVNYKNQADNDLYLDALRKAGLPEHPPRSLPGKPTTAGVN